MLFFPTPSFPSPTEPHHKPGFLHDSLYLMLERNILKHQLAAAGSQEGICDIIFHPLHDLHHSSSNVCLPLVTPKRVAGLARGRMKKDDFVTC